MLFFAFLGLAVLPMALDLASLAGALVQNPSPDALRSERLEANPVLRASRKRPPNASFFGPNPFSLDGASG
ncbi:MAG: hypothetical protein RLZZ519_3300, partial [Bacteroidota bacterium]